MVTSVEDCHTQLAQKQQELDTANAANAIATLPYPNATYRFDVDHRQLPNDDWDLATIEWIKNNTQNPVYSLHYYPHMASFVPEFWDVGAPYTGFFYPDMTGVTSLPEIPTGIMPNIRYFYFEYSYSNGPSAGDVGISDIPTSWRQMTSFDRFYFRRNEFTQAQQEGIINGLEREINAGMGSARTGTITIYLNSASTGLNVALDNVSLLANGWTVPANNRLRKTIAGRRVDIYHN